MAVNRKSRPEDIVLTGGLSVFAMGLLFVVLSILQHVPAELIQGVFTTGASLMILGILGMFLAAIAQMSGEL